MNNKKLQIDDKTKQAIEAVLSKGDRAEVIPVKDGVKVMRVRRETMKTGHEADCPKC